ncbi:MAG: hypothetical protein SFU86_12325 [Pirellulaceae bacterium]|nr:hypothetical protein [Pirellulaceae bacterium]
MSEPFDPYRKWLGIPLKDQPPNHYRLLGIANFESDPDVIENAAARQMSHVRTFQGGKHAALSQRVLTELSAAKMCLLVEAEKAKYDAALRKELAAAGKLSSEAPLDDDAAVEVPPPMPPFPAVNRPERRWKMEDAALPPPGVSPPLPPVPISMPVGTAVASVPKLKGRSSTAYRHKHKPSALPLVIMVVGLLFLVGGGVVAAIVMNQPARPEPHKTKPPVAERPPSNSNKHVAERPRPAAPVATLPPSSFPIGTDEPAPPAVAPPFKLPVEIPAPPSDDMPVVDRFRQKLFHANQALSSRDEEKFASELKEAETLLADPKLTDSQRGAFGEDVEHLRNLHTLIDQFWTTTEANLATQLKIGEPVLFFKSKVELVSLVADNVTLKVNDGPAVETAVRQMDPIAAALIAGKSANIAEPKTFLPILAFLSIDERAEKQYPEDNVVKFARRFFNENRLAGQRNLEIAARLGLKLGELPLGP